MSMTGESRYEYVCVQLTGRLGKNGDRNWTEQINEVAAHGWRLVSISDNMGTFERPHEP